MRGPSPRMTTLWSFRQMEAQPISLNRTAWDKPAHGHTGESPHRRSRFGAVSRREPDVANPQRRSSHRHPVNRAQLVAVGITEVSEIDGTRGTLAHAGRILGGRAAVRDPGLVPGVDLLGIAHREADRAAIGACCRLAIDRLGNHEPPAVMGVNEPALGVLGTGLTAHRGKHGVVEFPRSGDVVASDHDMAEHSVLPHQSTRARRSLLTGRWENTSTQ